MPLGLPSLYVCFTDVHMALSVKTDTRRAKCPGPDAVQDFLPCLMHQLGRPDHQHGKVVAQTLVDAEPGHRGLHSSRDLPGRAMSGGAEHREQVVLAEHALCS